MSENMGQRGHAPGDLLCRLYGVWGQTGLGLMITGNVMVDSRHLGEPGNLVLEDERYLAEFGRLAERGQAGGTPLWVQLNHPGRQALRATTRRPVAPSSVPLGAGGGLFARPTSLTALEIQEIVERFANSASLARRAGFAGVQIHGAHGYLISQFLSPLTNLRDDEWGGSLERRMRFLREVIQAVRARVGPSYPVGLKLNSSDFQRAGFSEEESIEVIRQSTTDGVDLLEITGGTYEGSLGGRPPRASTRAREDYFVEFARRVRGTYRGPLAATGGFRQALSMARAVSTGALDVIGLARPLALDPDLARRLLAGDVTAKSRAVTIELGVEWIDRLSLFDVGWYEVQMRRLARGDAPDPDLSPVRALLQLASVNGWSLARRLLRALG